MALSIPADFNTWPKQEQINHYLKAGLKIHPCYGPKATKCTSPGKQPRWKITQRLSAKPEEILEHFKHHPDDNVGMVPTGGHIALDIDAQQQAPRGAAESFRLLFPKLFERPYVPCTRGFHIHLLASAIPQNQGKIDVPDYLPGVNLEVHVGTGAPA